MMIYKTLQSIGKVAYDDDDNDVMMIYETLQSIGKGAYGYVKLARRKSDGKTVVVKSIKKSKINVPACWRHDSILEEKTGLAEVPLEVRKRV